MNMYLRIAVILYLLGWYRMPDARAFQLIEWSKNPVIAAHQQRAYTYLLSNGTASSDSLLLYVNAAEKLHQKTPEGNTLTYWMAVLCQLEHQPEGTSDVLERYIKRFWDSKPREALFISQIHYVIGCKRRQAGKNQEALTHFQQALLYSCWGDIDTAAHALPKMESIRDYGAVLAILRQRTELLTVLNRLDDGQRYQHWLFCLRLVEEHYRQDGYNALLSLPDSSAWRWIERTTGAYDWSQKGAHEIYSKVFRQALHQYNETKDSVYCRDAFLIAERQRQLQWRCAIAPDYFLQLPDSLTASKRRLEQHIRLEHWRILSARVQGDSLGVAQHRAIQKQGEDQLFKTLQRCQRIKPLFGSWYDLSKAASIAEVQMALPSDSAAWLTYSAWGGDSIAVFVVTMQDFWVEYKPTFKREEGDYLAQAVRLHQVYFPQRLPAHIRRLLVVADWNWGIPMEAWLTAPLAQGGGEQPDYRRLPYLVRRYSVAHQLSATTWMYQQSLNRQFANYQVLGIGATARSTPIDSPAVGQQLRWLSNNYTGYFQQDASLNDWQVYAGDYGFLHLVTPMHNDEGQLHLQLLDEQWHSTQLRANQLRAALTVLDGDFDSLPTDTLLPSWSWGASLYRWTYAGSAAFIVPDVVPKTKLRTRITAHFYELLNAGMSKDEALRQAQLFHLETAPAFAVHPTVWASYSFWGDTANVPVGQPMSRIWWAIIPVGLIIALGGWTMNGLRQRR